MINSRVIYHIYPCLRHLCTHFYIFHALFRLPLPEFSAKYFPTPTARRPRQDLRRVTCLGNGNLLAFCKRTKGTLLDGGAYGLR